MKQEQDFNKFISMSPEFGPLNATEEPTPEEKAAFEDINAELLTFVHGPKSDAVLGVMKNAPNLYEGVGMAAFQTLMAIKQNLEKSGEPIPSAALFGEGAGIHTAVDELFQLARAAKLPGSDDPDQYNAAMFEVMRLAGDHIQKSGEDESVMEAQELMVDVESTGGNASALGTYGAPHQRDLSGAIKRSLQQQQQGGGILGADPQQQQPQQPQQEGVPPQQGGPQGVLA